MIIIRFPVSGPDLFRTISQGGNINYAELENIEMSHNDWIIDPRPTEYQEVEWRFEFGWSGNTVSIQSITHTAVDFHDFQDFYEAAGANEELMFFRAYRRSIDRVPTFNSDDLEYTYHGLECEFAPQSITLARVHLDVREIRSYAFQNCTEMVQCSMEDNVYRIGSHAFGGCSSMVSCRLSASLTHIDMGAFSLCESLHGLFLPSNEMVIGGFAFEHCFNMKILGLPQNFNVRMGDRIINGCDALLGGSIQYDIERNHLEETAMNNVEVNDWLLQRSRGTPQFHKICQNTQVNQEMIRSFKDSFGNNAVVEALRSGQGGMVPLQILVYNPHATAQDIVACFCVNPSAAFKQDNTGRTAIDDLGDSNNHSFEVIRDIVVMLVTPLDPIVVTAADPGADPIENPSVNLPANLSMRENTNSPPNHTPFVNSPPDAGSGIQSSDDRKRKRK